MKIRTHLLLAGIWLFFAPAIFIWNSVISKTGMAYAQVPPVSSYYQVDPYWPKHLPNDWVTGNVGGACVTADDHVITVNRTADKGSLSNKELAVGRVAPPVIEFDAEGNVVNSWGDFKIVPNGIHDCYVDFEGNIWVGGNQDSIAQKYSRDGKLLLQIGEKGVFDTDDGTIMGKAKNSSKTHLHRPSSFAVDPANGDVYITDGYGNRRVVVFDKNGKYIRQFGRQATEQETADKTGGVFTETVHHVAMSNEGLLYVCDREGRQIQVFDKMGNFKSRITIPRRRADLPGYAEPYWTVFSRDPAQKYLIVAAGEDEAIWIVERKTGKAIEGFGNMGHLAGEFTFLHSLYMDSKNNLYIGETNGGRRAQKFKLVKPLP
jgi:hypothetical protein